MLIITHDVGYELVFETRAGVLGLIKGLESLLEQTDCPENKAPWIYAVGDADEVAEICHRIDEIKEGRLPFSATKPPQIKKVPPTRNNS